MDSELLNSAPARDFVGTPRLTIRMVARLQGFTDDWKVLGKKTASYRQVGNAFPPPVAQAVAFQIAGALLRAHRGESKHYRCIAGRVQSDVNGRGKSKMGRSPNAQLAVDQYRILADRFNWDRTTAWHGIVWLLMSCDVWSDGFRRLNTLTGKEKIPNVVVYRERNDYKVGFQGPNIVVRRAQQLDRLYRYCARNRHRVGL